MPASLKVTAANASRPFGTTNPIFTGTIVGATNGDNISVTYSCAANAGSLAGTYPIIPSINVPETNYSVNLMNGTLTVGQRGPVVTWTNPVPITYGTALTSNQLNAAANITGSFTYVPTNGTVLNAGTNILSVVFAPLDAQDYSATTNTVTIVVMPASLKVTAANASRPFGTTNPIFTGTIVGATNGDNIPVTYSCAANVGSLTGTYPIIPSLNATNYTVNLVNGMLTVGQAVPVVTWTNPVPITYGTSLTSNQLNATANVAGSFAYTPTNGTVLNAGTNILSVVFAPLDAQDYSVTTNTVGLIVSPASLTVTAANASRPFGTTNPTFTGTIVGATNGDNIPVTYSCAANTASPDGTYSIIPTLNVPQTNYSVNIVNGTLAVGKTFPLITWTNPVPITYGTALTSNQLNAIANISGNFTYTPSSGTVLNAETNTLSVGFTPADTADYVSITNTVALVVSPASLTVTASNASRAYGVSNPTFAGTVVGATNGDAFVVNYSCSATASSPAGTYAIVPSLNSPATNYSVNFVNGVLTVGQALPIVTWTNPVSIIYSTALTTNQLNATANVAGSFAYAPTNGTVLNTGTNVLSVVFAPLDTQDYTSTTNTVALVVSPASLTVTAADANRPFGTTNPIFTGTISGATNGDTFVVNYSYSATASSPAGTYAIVPSFNAPATNYSVNFVNGTLTINQADPIVTWTNPVPIVYGTVLTSNQLNATANVPGDFTYIPTNSTALNSGTNTLVVVFTPVDNADYATATNTVALIVTPAPLTITASNAARPYESTNPAFGGTIIGLTNGDNFLATYSCSASPDSPAGVYPIVPSLAGAATNYTVNLVNGELTIGDAAPVITVQPISHTVSSNNAATLVIAATGSPSPQYEWYFNGAFTGATNSVLSIPNFRCTNEGTYTVVVSNMAGSVTSAPAVLSLDGRCHIKTFCFNNGAMQLEFVAPAGGNYIIEASTDLVNWVPLVTNSAPNGLLNYSDTNTSLTQRFYRAVGTH